MVAPIIQSKTSADFDTLSSISPTKPSGLSVGDLLLVIIGTGWSPSRTVSISVPAGWTAIQQINTIYESIGAFYKVADSGDVSAGSYTFSFSRIGKGNWNCYRITGFDSGSIIGGSISGTEAEYSSISITGYTNANNDTLNFIAGACYTPYSSETSDDYAHAISNPSWTEQYDNRQSGGHLLGVSTATRRSLGSTGNVSWTISSKKELRMVAFSINPSVITQINPKIKIAGIFVTKPLKIKLSGTFVEKPIKVKVSGVFQ